MLGGENGKFLGIPAHQDRLNRDAVAIWKKDAAIVPDRQDGSHQMLAVAHPAGYAIHDHSNRVLGHPHLQTDQGGASQKTLSQAFLGNIASKP